MFRRLSICVFTWFTLQATSIKVPLETNPNLAPREHPGTYPFISHVTFRNVCNHIIDQNTEWFDPESVAPGDIIYLNIWFLQWFANHVHDQIRYPYILVTCDVGSWLPQVGTKKLLHDPKLATWFCRNMIFGNHPKIVQIPMGQDLVLFGFHDPTLVNDLIAACAKKPYPKKHLLYMNFDPRPIGNRDRIARFFEDKPFCFSRAHSSRPFEYLPRAVFYDEMASSYFTLSPIGLEMDCVRTWEALALDCIPIVEHTFIDPLFRDLPVVMVHNWEEIDQPFLERKLAEFKQQTFKYEKIYFDYWHDLIKERRDKIRNGDLAFASPESAKFNETDLRDLQDILSKHGVRQHELLYKGYLSGVRPMQLAKTFFISTIYLFDPWTSKDIFANYENYVSDKGILHDVQHKISFIHTDAYMNDTQFNHILRCLKACSIFLDLTHLQVTLRVDKEFRQSLKQDLHDLFHRLESTSLVCGNMAQDPYVEEVLRRFSQENHVTVEKQGSFWFVKKQ